MRRAIFRADASPAVGGGHVMRCLTLADRLKRDGWQTAFACSPETPETLPQLKESGHEILTLAGDGIEEMARHWPDGTDWLAVDHYGLDAGFETVCRPWAKKILVLDDMPTRRHDCDLLLDQNLGRRADDYAGLLPETAHVAAGIDYALLRPQFAKARTEALARRRERPPIRRILVGLSLTDPDNATALCLEGIAQAGLPGMRIDVLLGPGAPHLPALRKQAETLAVPVEFHIGVSDVATLLKECDLALGAPGSSAWERCALGLPTLLLILADNQRRNGDELAAQGAAVNLGDVGALTPESIATALRALASDPDALAAMAEAASTLCDGAGPRRMATALSKQGVEPA